VTRRTDTAFDHILPDRPDLGALPGGIDLLQQFLRAMEKMLHALGPLVQYGQFLEQTLNVVDARLLVLELASQRGELALQRLFQIRPPISSSLNQLRGLRPSG